MNRDPFDLLREQNPMPEEQPVYAPMSTARDIVGKAPRRTRPSWILAGAAAVAVLLVGGAWLLWLRDPNGTPVAASSTSTTIATTATSDAAETTAAPDTTAAPPTTVEGTTTTVLDSQLAPDVAVYFFMDDNGTQIAPGPFLVPVNRPLAILSHIVEDPIYESLQFLLAGPNPGETEAVPALSSAIPAGTRLLGLTVAGGVADVDLSAEFGSGGGTLSMLGRLAQVVFTLTRFNEVDAVTFRIEGEPTTVFGGEGIIVEEPQTREGWGDLTPAIMIEEPAYGGIGANPLVVRGTANVFEATVSLALTDADGLIIWQGFTTATCGTGCRGDFEVTIPYEVDETQMGALVAWEASAQDGRQTNVREHPVVLVPSGGQVTTTTQPDPIEALRAERTALDKELDAALTRIEEIDALLAAATEEQVALENERDELWGQVGDLRAMLSTVLDQFGVLGVEPAITCSALGLNPALEDQPDLPDPVANLRRALFEAALTCNWDALAALLPDAFTSSFGGATDPIAQWQQEELLHYEPMRYLAEILQRPFAVLEGDGLPTYAWPSAFAGEWDTMADADIEALRPLYGDADFASFAAFGGYFGYRTGITVDGNWVQWSFFVAGD